MKRIEYILMMIITFAVIASCSTNQSIQVHIPELTEQQKAVKIIYNNPEDNLKLKKNCEVLAVVNGRNERQFRILAVEKGGNVIEIMKIGSDSDVDVTYPAYSYYGIRSETTNTYYVGIIYKCPDDMCW